MKIREKRTYKDGLLFNSKRMVVAGDFYGLGTPKYSTKGDNYEALRCVKRNRL